MRLHLLLTTLSLLLGTSLATAIPRADNKALQDRTTIYFPGPIPGANYDRRSPSTFSDALRKIVESNIGNGHQAPATNSRRSASILSDAIRKIVEFNIGNGNGHQARANTPPAPAAPAAPPAGGEQTVTELAVQIDQIFAIIGKVAVGLVGVVILFGSIACCWRCHRKAKKGEMMEVY